MPYTHGKGAFGEVRLGKNTETKEFVAIKLESRFAKETTLQNEFDVCIALGTTVRNFTCHFVN
jgi:hypothetical protein